MPLDLDPTLSSGVSGTGNGVATERHAGYTYRPITTPEDATACFELQGEVWGSSFDRVPATLIRILTSIGGLAIGAFDDNGTLVGFVFSLAGMQNGEPIHWSHMLGVREDVRGHGVGRHLKEMQRAEVARRGIARVLWTFDPLQARNAHLNFNRLGVRLLDYVENMYGITQSPLHAGLATDRLVVMLTAKGAAAERPRLNRAGAEHARGDRVQVNGANGALPVLTPFPRAGDITVDLEDTDVPSVLIEIPTDLQQVIAATPELARTWRLATRESFLRAMRRGYQVTGLRRDLTTNRAFYTLIATPPADTGASQP
jgi:predicted GNAT superfamily acetyltransferase